MGKQYRVFVVEDENLIAKNIAKNIESANQSFKVAGIFSNGEDALAAIAEQPPEVVFTDISMPVMSGLELASKIHESFGHVKIVIITGYSDFEYVKEALHYDVEDYLLKPVNTEELSNVLYKLKLLFTDISDPHSLTGDNERDLTPEEIVLLVKEYVQKNYAKELDLNIIAQNLGFSSSYLTKIFNKIENITPSKYIRNYRMQVAKQLLGDNNMTISQIASGVGYNDPFHFSKSFKQTFGISPTEFRDRLSGNG